MHQKLLIGRLSAGKRPCRQALRLALALFMAASPSAGIEPPITIAAVGDLCGTSCAATAALVAEIDPAVFLALGDLAYPDGSVLDFRFTYDPQYGPYKAITRPAPGNHEYNTPGAMGYFDYFNGLGVFSGPAGDRDKGYYSFDLGDWHIVSLNSNLAISPASAQVRWLRADLAANLKPCTLAFWHHPRFTRANYSDSTEVEPLFQELQDAEADVVLAGHDHNYQRYRKMTAAGLDDPVLGLRSFVVGTGGRGFYPLLPDERREAGEASAYGVLKLELSARGYRWEFMPEAGQSFTDSGSDVCKRALVEVPGFGLTLAPAAITLVQGGSRSVVVTITRPGAGTGPLHLSLAGLPAGVTATFSPAEVHPPEGGSAASTLTLRAGPRAPAAVGLPMITAEDGSASESVLLAITVSASRRP